MKILSYVISDNTCRRIIERYIQVLSIPSKLIRYIVIKKDIHLHFHILCRICLVWLSHYFHESAIEPSYLMIDWYAFGADLLLLDIRLYKDKEKTYVMKDYHNIWCPDIDWLDKQLKSLRTLENYLSLLF